MPIRHYGNRLILANSSTPDEVTLFTQGAGFTEGRENNTAHGSEKVWLISSKLFFHYVRNVKSDFAYIQVTGEDSDDVERFTELADSFFTTTDVDELLSEVHAANTSTELAKAVTRLSVGIPSADPPADALHEILNSYRSKFASVRRAGLLAALYMDWDIVGPSVRNMAVADPSEELRIQAGYFVNRNNRSEGVS
ncbi:hypothetical protein [Streptomyces chilikensis]|uniref:hypothetical protein n=1 Tax=Streptomyces chilikensis TaxID=1194079 RepID=UPI000A522E76|nr:hypothetical protein [Streptomyces chilikensis]